MAKPLSTAKNLSMAPFDAFYEEFLSQLLSTPQKAAAVPVDFMRLQTDIERVEFVLQLLPFMRNFEIGQQCRIKDAKRSVQYREEGNKLFQEDQAMQSIVFYNKALSYAPHPAVDEYRAHPDQRLRSGGPKYEALALCYANRSAALRRLGQYEECLKDIVRAAKFGYPQENIYKLWERKAKCYHAMKKFELASKCYAQTLKTLDISALSDNQKTLKTHEIESAIKELRSSHLLLVHFSSSTDDKEQPDQLMGATGPIVLVPDPVPKRKLSQQASLASPTPETEEVKKPDRMRSFRIKKRATIPGRRTLPASPTSPLPTLTSGVALNGSSNTSSNRSISLGDDLSLTGNEASASTTTTRTTPSATPSATPSTSGFGELQKATSQVSISQLSTSGSLRSESVPELSHDSNPQMPSASAGIELRVDSVRGRHFVAAQDLFPGDVVLREEPYAAVLESIFRVNHCAHCLKKFPTPIPCYHCATVQYCSEHCRDQSWDEYHIFECGILGYLEPSRYLGKMPHLALRVITKTGLKNLITHSLNQSMLPTLKNESSSNNDNNNRVYDPTSYRSVHTLATNTDKRGFEDLIKRTAEAIFMAKCLKYKGFFDSHNAGTGSGAATADTRRAEIFVSSLLLRHLQIASTNGLQMAECLLKNNDVTKFDIVPVGGALFPTLSFFNHSCYPNALRLGYHSHQVVRIIRRIRAGEEVNIDYGFDFYADPIEERQRRALTQYYFQCKCLACANGWPLYSQLVNRPRVLKVRPSPDLSEELERQAAAYHLGMDYLLRLDISTALPLFRDYLLIMNEFVEHPDARYIDCEEAYKQCLWLENRGYKIKNQQQQQQQQQESALD